MVEDSDGDNGWGEYRKLILSDIKSLKVDIKEHTDGCTYNDKEFKKEFHTFRTEVISELKVIKTQISIRSSLWGAITGILGAIGVVLIYLATT
jgi:hypothetical protein